MPIDYDARCKAATAAQGLSPLIGALYEADVKHNIEQTGGFCMVLTVRAESQNLTYGVIQDGPDGRFLVCLYPGTSWEECEPEAASHSLTLDDTVRLLKVATS